MSNSLLQMMMAIMAATIAAVHNADTVPARGDDHTPGARYGILAGTVHTAWGDTVNDATVEIVGTSPRLGSYSRSDGSYRVPHMLPGTYRVVASHEPMLVSDTMIVSVLPGATTTLDIKLGAPHIVLTDSIKDQASDSVRSRSLLESDGRRSSEGADSKGAKRYRGMRYEWAPSDGKPARRLAKASPPPPPPPTIEHVGAGSGKAATFRTSVVGATSTGTYEDISVASSTDELRVGDVVSRSESHRTIDAPHVEDGTKTPAEPVRRPGQLTAGEWSDLENWAYWTDVASTSDWSTLIANWGYNPANRVRVALIDGERPVVDGEVRLVDAQGKVLWTARTDNRGHADLFPGVGKGKGDLHVEARMNGMFSNAGDVQPGSSAPIVIRMPGAAVNRNEFDLMFVIDATGSMGDEMEYLKAELENVIERNRETSNDDIALRLSCNVYRDVGDEYLVRPFAFSESTFDMIGNLRQQRADGGGDTPEAVEEALEDAIEKHDWNPAARARLLFLVLDAPPHSTPDRIEKLHRLSQAAAAKGIRIIPIASSGVDKPTEFLMRLLAIYSGGTYVFLTDDSGIGNSHVKPTIGKYNVEYLNDLMVRVIARYLAADQVAQNGNGIELH